MRQGDCHGEKLSRRLQSVRRLGVFVWKGLSSEANLTWVQNTTTTATTTTTGHFWRPISGEPEAFQKKKRKKKSGLVVPDVLILVIVYFMASDDFLNLLYLSRLVS